MRAFSGAKLWFPPSRGRASVTGVVVVSLLGRAVEKTSEMNSNIWNIREMLNIPTGAGMTKSATWNSAPSDHSSLTDSQFLFGSQFCPENSESQDFNLPSRTQRNSQQNSQHNESELKFYERYQAKPHIFATENKETSSVTQLCFGKPKGLLEQFEISKRKAKEKQESEYFNNWISKLQDNVEEIKASFNKLERKTELQNQTVLEGLEDLSKTIQENINTHYETIVSALEAKSSREKILEMDKRLVAKEMEMSNVKTQLQSVQECLDGMKHSQCQQHQKMCEQFSWFKDHFKFTEILSELHKLTSTTNPIIQVQNNMTQTTPSTSSLCIVSKREAYYRSTEDCRTSSQHQPTLIDNYQLHDTKAVCTDILPDGHLNVYQNILSESPRPRPCDSVPKKITASSDCEGRNEDTSTYSTAINSNHITSVHPVSVTNGLFSQAFIPGGVKLAEGQNDLKSNSTPFHKMHNNKENKWGIVSFSPSLKHNDAHTRWPNTTMKNRTTFGSAVTCKKIGIRRCPTKRRNCIPLNKEKDKPIKASNKSNRINVNLKKATLTELKITSARPKQSNGSEKSIFGKASSEKRRYPLEGQHVKDEISLEQVKKRNYSQQQKGKKEIPKLVKRNLSWKPPSSFQEGFLQNGMESDHVFQSWFSPLTPTLSHEGYYDSPTNTVLGREAQNKTHLNFFDSSEESD
ncbi:interactor of HORMAD1 protein 1 isoform X2 [Hypanus sabinus]|uniref:interactor of HORMAD1 protein 1 isoform X2 n=1 Tax=Hypanus sabinus TaxID=79690 RepID=UPI0028C47EB3|nr:interactor of HORMAD1 protein 1 isoform X2 [Hypanus sabinus]